MEFLWDRVQVRFGEKDVYSNPNREEIPNFRVASLDYLIKLIANRGRVAHAITKTRRRTGMIQRKTYTHNYFFLDYIYYVLKLASYDPQQYGREIPPTRHDNDDCHM